MLPILHSMLAETVMSNSRSSYDAEFSISTSGLLTAICLPKPNCETVSVRRCPLSPTKVTSASRRPLSKVVSTFTVAVAEPMPLAGVTMSHVSAVLATQCCVALTATSSLPPSALTSSTSRSMTSPPEISSALSSLHAVRPTASEKSHVSCFMYFILSFFTFILIY